MKNKNKKGNNSSKQHSFEETTFMLTKLNFCIFALWFQNYQWDTSSIKSKLCISWMEIGAEIMHDNKKGDSNLLALFYYKFYNISWFGPKTMRIRVDMI